MEHLMEFILYTDPMIFGRGELDQPPRAVATCEYVISSSPSALDRWGVTNMYITTFFYVVAVTLTKLALFVLCLRIFTGRFSRWCCCWIMTFVICARVASDAITIPLQCGSHPEYAWQPYDWAGNCDDIAHHYTYTQLVNILSDVMCLSSPADHPLHVKLGVMVPFLLGNL
jgi:hypothetical protein